MVPGGDGQVCQEANNGVHARVFKEIRIACFQEDPDRKQVQSKRFEPLDGYPELEPRRLHLFTAFSRFPRHPLGGVSGRPEIMKE